MTTYPGVLFTTHLLDTDLYFAQSLVDVFRNAIMGLVSFASGFFVVIDIGIFLLGICVAYGVVTGELDTTPIKQPESKEIVLPNVWGLMMGKKHSQRGNRGEGGVTISLACNRSSSWSKCYGSKLQFTGVLTLLRTARGGKGSSHTIS
jgi:hypothetical protein